MRILHVIDSEGFYGAEAMLVSLALEQNKNGDEAVICDLAKSGQAESKLIIRARQAGIKSVSIILGGNIWKQGRAILNYADSNNLKILHSHGYRPGILLGLHHKQGKYRFVRTLHGWTFTRIMSRMYVYALLDAILLRRQDHVIIVSNSMRYHSLLKVFGGDSISCIANGISVSTSDPLTDGELNDERLKDICNDNFVIGSIGRLSHEKAQCCIIRAVAKLRHKGYQVALVIIGEGRERESLEALAYELAFNKYCYLAGYKDNAARYLSIFNIFCLSSLTEGFPITVLEAMREGIPIIATKVGSLTDLLSEGRGILVDPADMDALVTELELLLNQPDKAKNMVNTAKRYFNANYSSEIMMHQYREIYVAVQ